MSEINWSSNPELIRAHLAGEEPRPDKVARHDEEVDDSESLDQLVRKIFEIIPSYYDKRQAAEIQGLIEEWAAKLEPSD